MKNDDKNLNFTSECKTSWLDDIFLGTKESQGIRNAVNAIKFVLFDDVSVLPDGLKYNDKYEFIKLNEEINEELDEITEEENNNKNK